MRYLKEISIEVTQACNSLCIFCSSLSTPFCENRIPYEKLIEIVKFSKLKGASSINISGGEPLLRSDLPEIIAMIESLGLRIRIYTSGNILKDEVFQSIISNLKSKDNICFIFNYPSVDNEVFQKLINSDKFEPSLIDFYMSRLLKNNISVEAHIVPNAVNVSSLYKTIGHLKNLGINQVSLLRLVLQGRAASHKRILMCESFEQTLEMEIKNILSTLQENKFKVRLGVPFGNDTKKECECFAGFGKLVFRYDGAVYPCEAFKEAPNNHEFILGNIYNDSLDSIWDNHPVHRKLTQLKILASAVTETCPAQLLY